MNKQNHSKKSDFDGFQSAFYEADQAIKKKASKHRSNKLFDSEMVGGNTTNRPKISGHVNLEQEGGARVIMNTNTVLGQANTAAQTNVYYITGGNAQTLYMRGEIIGNTLNVSLISALRVFGADISVTNVPIPPGAAGVFNWSQNVGIPRGDNHLIEIKEGKNIYSQHHLATITALRSATIAEALRLSNEWDGTPIGGGAAVAAAVPIAVAACNAAGVLVQGVNAAADLQTIYAALLAIAIPAGAGAAAAQAFLRGKADKIIEATIKNGIKYKFCQNGNPGTPLTDYGAADGVYYVPAGTAPVGVKQVAAPALANNNPGPVFNTRDFLIVDLTNAKVSRGAVETTCGPTNMTEGIINFLLHQLVQYKLANNILCIYDKDKVSSLTVRTDTTLTSYVNYQNIRLANEFHHNVFSQCFEYNNKSDNKLKLVHAVTQLEPSDSSISMKYCSTKNMNGLANLTKVLAISNPLTRRLSDDSIFYLCLRVHTLRTNDAEGGPANGAANADMVAAQRTADDRFLSGTFGENDGIINAAKLDQLNNPTSLATRFDEIFDGTILINSGIGRYAVDSRNELMTYDDCKLVRLVSKRLAVNRDQNAIVPHWQYYHNSTVNNAPSIVRNGNTYELKFNTKDETDPGVQGPRTFINDNYDPALIAGGGPDVVANPAILPIRAGYIAMHVCTTNAEANSNVTLADALFEKHI
jgi:hypothetical protein